MIGVGFLTLPTNLKETGLIWGLVIIFIAGLSSFYGTFMLGSCY